MAGGVGSDDDKGGGKKTRHTPIALPVLPVWSIKIASDSEIAGRLVEIPFTLYFYSNDDKETQPVPVTWHSKDPTVARVNTLRDVIVTEHEGYTEIWCESENGVKSNIVQVRVVDCNNIEFSHSSRNCIGKKIKIKAIANL